MGMYDEVRIICPKCDKTTVVQTKWGPCSLNTYTLETAPLAVIADLNDEGNRDRLYCEHCKTKLEVPVKFWAGVCVKSDREEREEWRDA